MKRVVSLGQGVLVSVLLVFLASTVFAAEGPYVSVLAGATFLEDAENSSGPDSIDAESDTGVNVGASLGYDYGLLRFEGEATYRQNDVDKLEAFGLSVGADGETTALSLMFNAFIDLENPTPIVPYVGAGVGVAQISFNDVEVAGFDLVDDDDTVLAYQVGAGLAIAFTPFTSLDLGYRYFATDDPEFEDEAGDEFDSEYHSHNLSLGLRITF